MRLHDGGEGPIGAQGYLILWPLLETIENTEGYEVEQVQKGLLLFATDGGDTAYAFDRVDPDWAVVEVSLSSASPEDVEFYARNFAEFVVRLARENGLFDLMAGPA